MSFLKKRKLRTWEEERTWIENECLKPLEREEQKLVKRRKRWQHRLECISFVKQQSMINCSWKDYFPYLQRQVENFMCELTIPEEWKPWILQDMKCHPQLENYSSYVLDRPSSLGSIYDHHGISCPFLKRIYIPYYRYKPGQWKYMHGDGFDYGKECDVWMDSPYDNTIQVRERLPYEISFIRTNQRSKYSLCVSTMHPDPNIAKGHVRALLADFFHQYTDLYDTPVELIHLVLDYLRYPDCTYPHHFDLFL